MPLWAEEFFKLSYLGGQVLDRNVLVRGFAAKSNSNHHDGLESVLNAVNHTVSANANSVNIL
jgi:hypothetical protein